MIQCRVERKKGGMASATFYELCTEVGDIVLLSAYRDKLLKMQSSYPIRLGDRTSPATKQIGKLKCSQADYALHGPGVNVKKKDVWDDDFDEARSEARQQICSIKLTHTTHTHRLLLPNSPGPRDMAVTMSDLAAAASPGGSMTDRQYSLKNRHPQWDKELGCFLLNFNGRVSHSSRKNFQLVMVDEKVVMQFGKRGKNTFILDWGWPLTPIQAFGIALAVMDHSKKHFG